MSSGSDVTVTSRVSGVSDFLRRRITGEVPVFGGDPRRGWSEFRDAASDTATYLRQAIFSNMSDAAAIAAQARARFCDVHIGSFRVGQSILSVNKIQTIQSLLQPGISDGADQLVLAAQTRAMAKAERQASATITEEQVDTIKGEIRSRAEIVLVSNTDKAKGFLNSISYALKLPGNLAIFQIALTHSSAAMSYNNDLLAAYGDSIAKAILAKKVLVANDPSGAKWNSRFQAEQSNVVWAGFAKSLNLFAYMDVGGAQQSVVSDKVFATTFEAVLAAMYLDGGEIALAFLNKIVEWCND